MQWTPDMDHAPMAGEVGIKVFVSKELGGERYVGLVNSDKFCLIATGDAEQAATAVEDATLDESGLAEAIRNSAEDIRKGEFDDE